MVKKKKVSKKIPLKQNKIVVGICKGSALIAVLALIFSVIALVKVGGTIQSVGKAIEIAELESLEKGSFVQVLSEQEVKVDPYELCVQRRDRDGLRAKISGLDDKINQWEKDVDDLNSKLRTTNEEIIKKEVEDAKAERIRLEACKQKRDLELKGAEYKKGTCTDYDGKISFENGNYMGPNDLEMFFGSFAETDSGLRFYDSCIDAMDVYNYLDGKSNSLTATQKKFVDKVRDSNIDYSKSSQEVQKQLDNFKEWVRSTQKTFIIEAWCRDSSEILGPRLRSQGGYYYGMDEIQRDLNGALTDVDIRFTFGGGNPSVCSQDRTHLVIPCGNVNDCTSALINNGNEIGKQSSLFQCGPASPECKLNPGYKEADKNYQNCRNNKPKNNLLARLRIDKESIENEIKKKLELIEKARLAKDWYGKALMKIQESCRENPSDSTDSSSKMNVDRFLDATAQADNSWIQFKIAEQTLRDEGLLPVISAEPQGDIFGGTTLVKTAVAQNDEVFVNINNNH